jgi:esterase/lipase
MQRRARQAATHVHVPTLVIQGDADWVLDPAGAAWLYRTIPAADKEFRLLSGAGHDLVSPWNLGHHTMIETTLAWMAKRFG